MIGKSSFRKQIKTPSLVHLFDTLVSSRKKRTGKLKIKNVLFYYCFNCITVHVIKKQKKDYTDVNTLGVFVDMA